MDISNLTPLKLEPEYRPYVWGGTRLRPGAERTAEAWVVYEHNRILSGPLAGLTLGESARQYGADLVGGRVFDRTGPRFPILIKLLDCAAWLSLQVHPNDEQAVRLEGAGQFGKTEAWHVLDAAPGTELLCGLLPGISRADMERAIRTGGLLPIMQRLPTRSGDTIFIPPGMIHALGPGLLIYEIQQTSDLTYRVYDWDRPVSQGRALHIQQSLAVADPSLSGQVLPLPALTDGSRHNLAACTFFTLQILNAQTQYIKLETRGESFHALTVIQGRVMLEGPGWSQQMDRFESCVIPAACSEYHLRPLNACQVLVAFVD